MLSQRADGVGVAVRGLVVEHDGGGGRDQRVRRQPAISVCVPQLPNGASMLSLSPRGARPRRRVRFVFTAVSSKNTTGSGRAAMAGRRGFVAQIA
ncbi:hypothetical protein LZ186_02550 [Rhodovulum sulfidophilum]|nr:hypothetical protein [Rhodovulum sulfidophilum]